MNENHPHSLVGELVGRGRRVLVVGGTDGLGATLAALDAAVTDVAVDDDTLPSAQADAGAYDAVVIAGVLERLADPAGVLADAAKLLAPGGRVVAVLPNVTHGSVRLALLEGRWQAAAAGRTHLFDRAGLAALVHAAGLAVDDLRGTMADPLDVGPTVEGTRLPANLVEWVRDQPDALVEQFVLSAHPASEEERAQPGLPELVPAVPEADVRRSDRFTERAQADLEERHRVLTLRDHVIGLEAAAATAQFAAEGVERKLRGATKRLNRKNDRIKELTKQVKRLEGRLEAGGEPPAGWRQKLGRGGS